MFSAVRGRFTYANVVMTLALVFAMTGGAYAAKHYLITSTKQISPKVLKQLKGKNGSPGATGPQGLQGSTGSAGKDGTNGTSGKDGVSVASSTEPPGANCKAGGSKFVATNGTTYACNGENGQTGFTETLPSGKTEKGTWAMQTTAGYNQFLAVSFPIPLAKAPKEVHIVHAKGTAPSQCAGGSVSEPKASAGNLCVYEGEMSEESGKFTAEILTIYDPESPTTIHEAAGKSGATLIYHPMETGTFGYGDWAVTAE